MAIERVSGEEDKINARRGSKLTCACLVSAILLVPVAIFSQSQSSSNQNAKDEPVIACTFGVNMVVVEVEVKDQYGGYVTDLNHKEFIVYDDNERQEIQYFSQEKGSDKEEERTTYKIGYFQPDITLEGEHRRIRVKLRNSKSRGMKVSYRPKSYLAMFPQW